MGNLSGAKNGARPPEPLRHPLGAAPKDMISGVWKAYRDPPDIQSTKFHHHEE